MPSPKKCAEKFPVGSQGYKDCVSYKNQGKGKPLVNRRRKLAKTYDAKPFKNY